MSPNLEFNVNLYDDLQKDVLNSTLATACELALCLYILIGGKKQEFSK